jgi:hypothetical protein
MAAGSIPAFSSQAQVPNGRFKGQLARCDGGRAARRRRNWAATSLVVRNPLRSGALVAVLPDYRLHRLNVDAVYVSCKYIDAKVKSWIDFARERAANADGRTTR